MPSLYGRNTTVRLHEETLERLRAVAREEDRSRDSLMRRIIERGLAVYERELVEQRQRQAGAA